MTDNASATQPASTTASAATATPRDPKSPPRWVPAWMTERERAAGIVAAGIILGFVLGAMMLSFGIFVSSHLH